MGAVSSEDGRQEVLGFWSVTTSSRTPLPERLRAIHDEISSRIAAVGPDEVAVEDVFQARNVRSALKLGHARGVALLAAAQRSVPIFEYAPREVKKSVVGVGSASKDQVASMIGRLLGVDVSSMKADESDALAVALCHIHKRDGSPFG
ncbi:MAG: crossover junction endodeoxyribonuclease RuvC [Candidatus Eisenbacteria bacterium]|nr:crossover junction endodeoxyribonuclease RuvC [Candidatus Eisenbacteria bacterium]